MSALQVAAGGCALLALAAALGGCESTQDKSARLKAQAKSAIRQTGLKITKVNPDVKVVATGVLQDANGAAVVAVLRNTGRHTLVDVPIAIDVRDAHGKTLFRNDNPGAAGALVSAPLLEPGTEFTWVHDQVQVAGGKPASVKVTVGEARTAPGAAPHLEVGAPKLVDDPSSGVEATGSLHNASTFEQRRLTIFAVARKGKRIVAAGRAVVARAKAGKTARYSVFFIGNPRGARLELSAPPVALAK